MADGFPFVGVILADGDAPTLLPPFLLLASLDDVEIDFITAGGHVVEPNRYEASKVRGFNSKLLPLPHLRAFCTLMSLTV